jgi:hypothetical protein
MARYLCLHQKRGQRILGLAEKGVGEEKGGVKKDILHGGERAKKSLVI